MSNDIEEIEFLTHSAERGNARSQCELGRLHLKGDESVDEDLPKAAMWLRRASEQGNSQAQNLLGYMLFQGKGVLQNKEESFKWYLASAEQGNAGSQFTLGVMYAFGEGVARDTKESYVWLYLAGKSEEKDYREFEEKIKQELPVDERLFAQKKAEQWLLDKSAELKALKADAEKGDTKAQYNLGVMHLNGYQGIEKNIEKATKLIKLSAEWGYADAQNTVGRELFDALDLIESVAEKQKHDKVPIILEASIKAIKEADNDERPDFRIKNDLGIMLLESTDAANAEAVEQKVLDAVDWLYDAAYQGNVYAQYNLAQIYRNGEKTSMDHAESLKEAYIWISVAACSGYDYILSAKEEIEQDLKDKKIHLPEAEAKERAERIGDPSDTEN